jgi:hypothetical protein
MCDTLVDIRGVPRAMPVLLEVLVEADWATNQKALATLDGILCADAGLAASRTRVGCAGSHRSTLHLYDVVALNAVAYCHSPRCLQGQCQTTQTCSAPCLHRSGRAMPATCNHALSKSRSTRAESAPSSAWPHQGSSEPCCRTGLRLTRGWWCVFEYGFVKFHNLAP